MHVRRAFHQLNHSLSLPSNFLYSLVTSSALFKFQFYNLRIKLLCNLAIRGTNNSMSMKLMREFSGVLDVEIKDSPILRLIQVNV